MNEAHQCWVSEGLLPLSPISTSAGSRMEPTGSEFHQVLVLVCFETKEKWLPH